jgi:hypothetical protein
MELRNWKLLKSRRFVYLMHGLEKTCSFFFNYPIHYLPLKMVDKSGVLFVINLFSLFIVLRKPSQLLKITII